MDETRRDFARALAAATAGPGEEHPTTETLVAYRQGNLDAHRDDAVQEHLARCRACSDLLLELVEFSRGGDDTEPSAPHGGEAEREEEALWSRFAARLRDEAAPSTPPSPSPIPPHPRPKLRPARWATALAAVFLVSTIGLGIWVAIQHQQLAVLRRPRVNFPIVNLEAVGYTRGDSPPATIGAGRPAVLILNPPSFPTARDYSVEVLAADGRRLWSGSGLTPTDAGNFYVQLPAAFLRPGEILVRLLLDGDEVAVFPLQVTP